MTMTDPPTSDTEHRRHNLRTRALLALRRAGVTTVGQLAARTDDQLLGVTNVGVDSVAELRRATVEADLAADEALSRLVWPRPVSPRDREILAMRDEGITFAEIGRRLGISTERVRQILTRLNTPPV